MFARSWRLKNGSRRVAVSVRDFFKLSVHLAQSLKAFFSSSLHQAIILAGVIYVMVNVVVFGPPPLPEATPLPPAPPTAEELGLKPDPQFTWTGKRVGEEDEE